MLVLSITMVLIAAVFAFVLRTPAPSTAPTNEFSVALQRNATQLLNVSITYVIGSPMPAGTLAQAEVVLTSAAHPTAFSSPFSIAAGHVSPSSTWNPGVAWWLALGTYHLPATDNLTVKVIANQHLIFSTVAPGPTVVIAPYFLSVWTSPTTLAHGAPYTIYATIAIPDGLGSGSVKANLSLANGPSTAQTMTAGNSSGVSYWSYSPSTYPTTAGTFAVYLVVTDSLGATSTDVVNLIFS